MKLDRATDIPAAEKELKARLEKLGGEWSDMGRLARDLSVKVNGYADDLRVFREQADRVNGSYGQRFRIREEDLRAFAEELRKRAESDISLGAEMREVQLTPGGAGGNQYEELARDRHPTGLRFRWSG